MKSKTSKEFNITHSEDDMNKGETQDQISFKNPQSIQTDWDERMHISSLVVHVQPEHLLEVIELINTMSEAEVHASDASGKIVVVLETENERQILDSISKTENLKGVMAATMVYHQIDQAD